MRVQVLGPVRVWRGGDQLRVGPTGRRAVLGLLALAVGRPLSRAEILDALWRDRPPSSAVNVIQSHVTKLRRVLEPDRPPRAPSAVLPAVGDGYALHVPPDAVDLGRSRRLVATAAGARREGNLPAAAAHLREALGLWAGAPLADVPFLADHPAVTSLVTERWATVARYGEVMLAAGGAAEVLPLLEQAAAALPLDEDAHARLIRAYHATGQRGRAFAAYHETRRRLADELGVDPGADLAAAHAELLRDPPAPGAAQAPEHRQRIIVPTPAQLPADVPGFTGRTAELSELDRLAVDGSGAVVISAVSGTAGVGKTALVVHWAQRVRDRFPDGQLYVDLRGFGPDPPVPAGDALARFLSALGVSGPDIPPDVDDRAARYRTETSDRRLLVVLDNAADGEQVRPLLPGSATCTVLVTSRDSLAGLVARFGARRLDLGLLPHGDARSLLRLLIGARVPAEPRAADVLAEQCARLPLALRVAAELAVARPDTTVHELTVELADRRRRLDLLDANGDPRAALRAVFSWSCHQLPPDAARVLRLLGLHPATEYDAHAAAALIDAELADARRLLDLLTRAHLVTRDAAGRYGMHDLLRAYAVDLATEHETERDVRAALGRLFDHYAHTASRAMDVAYPFETGHRPEPPAARTAVPDLGAAGAAEAWLDAELDTVLVTAAHGGSDHIRHQAATLHRHLRSRGQYVQATALQRHALEAARTAGDRAAELDALNALGHIHRMRARYDPAATCYRQALILAGDLADPAGELQALLGLGNIDRLQGRYGQSSDTMVRALRVARQLGHRVGQQTALLGIAHVQYCQGGYLPAAERFGQALDIARDLGDRIGEMIALIGLGYVHRLRGRCDPAAAGLDLALQVARQLRQPHGELIALVGLGDVARVRGRYGPATDNYRQALDIATRIGDRIGRLNAMLGLGHVLRLQARLASAADEYRRALILSREVGERGYEFEAYHGLARVLHAAGHHRNALTHHREALALANALGRYADQARAHDGLAHTHGALGDLDRASRHWRHALSILTSLGTDETDDERVSVPRIRATLADLVPVGGPARQG